MNILDKNALKILLLEDNPGDVELIKYELSEADLDYDLRHVYTKIDFLKELDEYTPDIILADYTIPNFSGTEALILVKELCPEVPLVVVTGTIDEETAVDCMKAGAVDYVLKSSLKRLSSAIKSGIEKRKLSKLNKKIQEELVFSVSILESIPEATIVINTKGEINYWNKSAEKMFGYDKNDTFNKKIMFFESKEKRDNFLIQISSLVEKNQYQTDEYVFDSKNHQFWVSIKATILYNRNDIMIGFLCTISDISSRKLRELELEEYYNQSKIIFSSFPDIVLRFSKEMILLDTRIPLHLEFLHPPKDVNGKSIYELSQEYNFISKELISQFNYYALLTFKTGYVQLFETKFVLFNNLYNFEIRFSQINDKEILAIIRDITGQEHTKNKSDLSTNITTGTIQHAIDGKISYVSQEIVEILGYETEDELIHSLNIKDLYANYGVYDKSLSSMIINEVVINLETTFRKKDQTEIDVNINARLIKDKVKNSVYFEMIVHHKQEIESYQNKIKYHQDIESLSILVTDSAYKLNSISTSLAMNTYILGNEINLEENPSVKENIKDMEKLINNIPEISNKLLNFNQMIKSDH